MLFQPQSWHPDVWTDITRMLTLNSTQAAKGKADAPLPDAVRPGGQGHRAMVHAGRDGLRSFFGDWNVPYRAVKLGRKGLGIELNHAYFLDAAGYCEAAEREMAMPSLFDLTA
jgi:hypothetical protein